MIEREKQTIEVWNVCTCGSVLHSIAEGERGACSSCWFKAMKPDTKAAMNKLVGAAFRDTKPSDAEKDRLVDEAMAKLDRDRTQEPADHE